jgi:DNA-binding NarL/FixJ family response regulator
MADAQQPGGPTGPSVHAPHRILIVDDQADLRELLRTRFHCEADLEVVGEASNGEEAVRLTEALAPSAVVLDLDMPIMRGDEAIPLLRAAAPGVGILLYSGAPERAFSEDARPDVIVRKGTPLAEVVAKVRTLVANAPFDVMRLQLGSLATAAGDHGVRYVDGSQRPCPGGAAAR